MTYYFKTDTRLFNDDGDEDEEEGDERVIRVMLGVSDCDKRMFFQSSLLYGLDDFTSII